MSHTLLFQAGFVPYRCGPLAYWYRPCIGRPTGSPEPLPMVFFHGISPGLFVYVGLLKNLVQGRAALFVEMPHVGMGLDLRPPTQAQTVKAVRRALKRHGVNRCCVVGHSYGTFCAGWMATGAKDVVAQLVLIDPMCLLLALPDVTYNFLYRRPSTWMQRFVFYGAGSEMGVNNALRRHFWWFNSVVFAHEIADIPTVVHLASLDAIAPSAHIRDYLGAHFATRLKVTGLPDDPAGSSSGGGGDPSAILPTHDAASCAGVSSAGGPSRGTDDYALPPPPESCRSPSRSPKAVGGGATWGSASKGHSSTLELVWSEGFAHGQIIASPSRQREIARRMFLQECRIFAEESAGVRPQPLPQESAQGSALGVPRGDAQLPGVKRPLRAVRQSHSEDEWDELSPRLC